MSVFYLSPPITSFAAYRISFRKNPLELFSHTRGFLHKHNYISIFRNSRIVDYSIRSAMTPIPAPNAEEIASSLVELLSPLSVQENMSNDNKNNITVIIILRFILFSPFFQKS